MSKTAGNLDDVSTSSSTRDAVESSIEISKDNKGMTWEESAVKRLAKVSRWEDGKRRVTHDRTQRASP